MNLIKVTAVFLFLSLYLSNDFSFRNENFRIVINQDRNGLKFEGVSINNEKMIMAKYFYKKCLFGEYKFHYKSVSIKLKDLDPLSLYRLEMFVIENKNLSHIGSGSTSEVKVCSRRNIYTIINGSNESRIVDINYCKNECYNEDAYLLNELEFLVNSIIPERYKHFSLPSYNYPCIKE